ncbi:DNA-processing protein DprA [Alkalicoccus luteus]|uniref:DNA-protecting protein DprA n=1 Tax=Alkalicoccus luteus TaxID=1237094 RepID=A0A969TTW7_9BACI|nr:DNA-protecting protein DprA [Alkalicoccus luteus]
MHKIIHADNELSCLHKTMGEIPVSWPPNVRKTVWAARQTLQNGNRSDSGDIQVVTFADSHYPEQLRHISCPPAALYFRGDLSIVTTGLQLAVVGSRKPPAQAVTALNRLMPEGLPDQTTIISGLAAGIDSHAHRSASMAGIRTAAVLGHGHGSCYPAENRNLKKDLERKELVLSEYPPNIKPERWMFPERNRIISGLADAVLVVSAAARSGSLITAEIALEQGREVFAVPGSYAEPSMEGCNELIRDGAGLISKPIHLSEELEACLRRKSCLTN